MSTRTWEVASRSQTLVRAPGVDLSGAAARETNWEAATGEILHVIWPSNVGLHHSEFHFQFSQWTALLHCD